MFLQYAYQSLESMFYFIIWQNHVCDKSAETPFVLFCIDLMLKIRTLIENSRFNPKIIINFTGLHIGGDRCRIDIISQTLICNAHYFLSVENINCWKHKQNSLKLVWIILVKPFWLNRFGNCRRRIFFSS